jgi:hypothetical protein
MQGDEKEKVVSSSEPPSSLELKGTGPGPRRTEVDTAQKTIVGTDIAPRGRSKSEPPPELLRRQRGSKRRVDDLDTAELSAKKTKYAHSAVDRGYNSDPEEYCGGSTSRRSPPPRKSSSAAQRWATNRTLAVRRVPCGKPTSLSTTGVEEKMAVSDDGPAITATEVGPVGARGRQEVRPRAKPKIRLTAEEAAAVQADREARFREALWAEFMSNAAVFERARLVQWRAREANASREAAQAEAFDRLVGAIHEGIMSRARGEGDEDGRLLFWYVVAAIAILLVVLVSRYASE